MLDLHRNWFLGLEARTAKFFAVLPLTPNHYTSLSVAAILVCVYFLLAANYWLALVFFAAAAFLDFIDGAVARAKNLSTKKGAYWDTIADRYVESLLLFGILLAGLPQFYLPSAAWIFLALMGSLMTTYAKAAAKEKGLAEAELKGGLISRGERILILMAVVAAMSFSKLFAVYLIVFLAIASNATAIQRIRAAIKN